MASSMAVGNFLWNASTMEIPMLTTLLFKMRSLLARLVRMVFAIELMAPVDFSICCSYAFWASTD